MLKVSSSLVILWFCDSVVLWFCGSVILLPPHGIHWAGTWPHFISHLLPSKQSRSQQSTTQAKDAHPPQTPSLPLLIFSRRIPQPAGGHGSPHRGAPHGCPGVQGGAGHAELQGRGAPGPGGGVVQGRGEGGDGPGRSPLPPHPPPGRIPLLPPDPAREAGKARRGHLCLRGQELPGRGHQQERFPGGGR